LDQHRGNILREGVLRCEQVGNARPNIGSYFKAKSIGDARRYWGFAFSIGALLQPIDTIALPPSPAGEGWGEGDWSALKSTLIPTLLPLEKGFNVILFICLVKVL
jgi:hypothetical protein